MSLTSMLSRAAQSIIAALVATLTLATAAQAANKWHRIDVRVCDRAVMVRTPERFPASATIDVYLRINGVQPPQRGVNTWTLEWAGLGIIGRAHQSPTETAPLMFRVASVHPGCIRVVFTYHERKS